MNSFGFGGTNAHILLETPPGASLAGIPPAPEFRRPLALTLSARCPAALKESAMRYGILLRGESTAADICSSAHAHRDHLKHRLVALGSDASTLAATLERWTEDPSGSPDVLTGEVPAVPDAQPVFVFTGQGSPWWSIGQEFLARETVFRDTISEVAALLEPLADWSLLGELGKSEADSRLRDTAIAQPALFAVQAGLVALWKSRGVTPSMVIGHSVGEVAAALAAGILSLRQATELVFHRSRLQASVGGRGRMVAVGLTHEEALVRLRDLDGQVAVAGINSPSLVTLAGDTAPLESLIQSLADEGRFLRWLPIDYAFHTHQMDPIEGELRAALRDLTPAAGAVPFISTVDAEITTQLNAGYWWRNVREPVQFARAVDLAIAGGKRTFLEIGVHPSLGSSVRDCLGAQAVRGHVFHSLKRQTDDSHELARNFAGLHVIGASVDWKALLPAAPAGPVQLPSYPWQRKSYWLESPITQRSRTAAFAHPLLGLPMEGPQPRWGLLLDPRCFPYLADHTFWNRIVFPAAAYVEIGLAVGRIQNPESLFAIEDFEMTNILFVASEDVPTLRVESDEADQRFRIFSRPSGTDSWTLHATGRLVAHAPVSGPPIDLSAIRDRLPDHSAHWDYYENFRKRGYDFGPAFRQIEQAWHRANECLAEVVLRLDLVGPTEGYHFHPTLIDACIQTMLGTFSPDIRRDRGDYFLPASVASFHLGSAKVPRRFWVHATIIEQSDAHVTGDLDLSDSKGVRFAVIRGLRLDRVQSQTTKPAFEDGLYELAWEKCSPEDQPESSPKRQIILLADSGTTSSALQVELKRRGYSVIRVGHGPAYEKRSATSFVVDPGNPDDFTSVLSEVSGDEDQDPVVAHLWGLDHPDEAQLDPSNLRAAQTTGVLSLLALAQCVEKLGRRPRVACFVRSIGEGEPAGVARLAAAPVIGFLRTAANELPDVHWSFTLLDPLEWEGQIAALADELTGDDPESEVAYFHGERHVRRLRRTQLAKLPRRTHSVEGPDGSIRPFRIENERPSTLDHLVLNETFRPELGPDEVDVRVVAAGINFRDLMKALAIYPGEDHELRELGDDFSGIVERVGPAVGDLRPGDPVWGLARYSFQSHVIANRHFIFPKPASISFEAAATIPTAFLTARYALVDLARLQAGESILIHAAAGGVGLAAIQVAQRIGLTIFATAGSHAKRQFLRDLGVRHVMDSRSLSFSEEVRQLTENRGVDAVLNSLSGEFIPKSLAVLAPFGRFLEIGKVDIFANRNLGMFALRNNIAFFAIDVAELIKKKPTVGIRLFEELAAAFRDEHYRPLPHRAFRADEIESAFREMAQGKHIGKLVLNFAAPGIIAGRITESGHLFDNEKTYLISGGANGFGFEVAKLLVRHGARHVALLSRSGPGTEEIAAEIDELRQNGADIRDLRTDVVDAVAVRDAVQTIESELPPIGGVIHAATVLNDHLIAEASPLDFAAALDPKVHGAWNLHAATLHRKLDFFVGFSSVTAVVGSPRQANYCAGNTFLDELARYREAIGLPGLSINWGALSGAGMVERDSRTRAYLELIGVETFDIREALLVLEKLLSRRTPQITAARIEWSSLIRLAPKIGSRPLYAPIVESLPKGRRSGSIRAAILTAPPDQRQRLLEDFVTEHVATVFGAVGDSFDRTVPVNQLGLDSIMAIELLNRIESELGIHFPMGSVLNGPSIEQLSRTLLQSVQTSGDDGDESIPVQGPDG